MNEEEIKRPEPEEPQEPEPEPETATRALAKVDTRSLTKVDRHVSLTALILPEGLNYDQWADYAKGLSVSRRMVRNGSLMWHVGDWLLYGEQNVGEAYSQAVAATGYDKHTLYSAKHVASKIPPSRRRESLSWSHHKVVAGLPEADQEYLLQLAATDHLSYGQINKMAAAIRHGVADAESTFGQNGDEHVASPEDTARRVEQAWEALKRDMQLLNDQIDEHSAVAFAFWETLNNQSSVSPEDLGKLQAVTKSVSEISGRIAHTIYALL